MFSLLCSAFPPFFVLCTQVREGGGRGGPVVPRAVPRRQGFHGGFRHVQVGLLQPAQVEAGVAEEGQGALLGRISPGKWEEFFYQTRKGKDMRACAVLGRYGAPIFLREVCSSRDLRQRGQTAGQPACERRIGQLL